MAIRSRSDRLFDAGVNVGLLLVMLAAVVPLLVVVTASFTPYAEILKNGGYTLLPRAFTLDSHSKYTKRQIWMVYPNILPPSVAESASGSGNPPTPHPPRVEYLSTLAKHQAPVNVVRFSPSGMSLESIFLFILRLTYKLRV